MTLRGTGDFDPPDYDDLTDPLWWWSCGGCGHEWSEPTDSKPAACPACGDADEGWLHDITEIVEMRRLT